MIRPKIPLSVILFVALCVTRVDAVEMRFALAGTGGNCDGCSWLVADGDIALDTAEKLAEFLRSKGLQDGVWDIELNSAGGSLIGGIKLGQFIRDRHFNTRVGRTKVNFEKPHELPSESLDGAVCYSACVYAFIGGLSRTAVEGQIGVHQFYNQAAIEKPTEKLFTALDLSSNQILSGILLEYVVRMGVDARLVSVAANTPPDSIKRLSVSELTELKISWAPGKMDRWGIRLVGSGAVAFVQSADGLNTVSLYCAAGGKRYAAVSYSFPGDIKHVQNAFGAVAAVSILGHEIEIGHVNFRTVGTKYEIRIELPSNVDFRNVRKGQNIVGASGTTPRFAWGYFALELPLEELGRASRIAFRNCI